MTPETLKTGNDLSNKINFLNVELLKWEKSIGFYEQLKLHCDHGFTFTDAQQIDFTILKDYVIKKIKAEISIIKLELDSL